MKELTENEIARTSFRSISNELWNSPYGYTHQNRDKNEMCPYCKNEDTNIVLDPVLLGRFMEFHRAVKSRLTVVECLSCSAVFSIIG